MTFRVTIQANIRREEKFWGGLPAQQNRAASQALTAHAKASHQEQRLRMGDDINRPNPFTRNSMVWYGAKISRLESGVFVKRRQAEYLARLVTRQTTTRNPKNRYIFVPSRSERRDSFGNMSRARRRNVLNSAKLIVKNDGGSRHAFLRQGKRLIYVGSFVKQTRYPRQYWPFFERAQSHYTRTFPSTYATIWNRVLSTHSSRNR